MIATLTARRDVSSYYPANQLMTVWESGKYVTVINDEVDLNARCCSETKFLRPATVLAFRVKDPEWIVRKEVI